MDRRRLMFSSISHGKKVLLIDILMILQLNLLHQKKKDLIELPSFLDFGLKINETYEL
jgi:hypothetical protein